jgi:hypothetical protein|tara:strand:+ start:15553 stop:15711 length:159 start_codon:yes stop_codon:yes gene_type:complete
MFLVALQKAENQSAHQVALFMEPIDHIPPLPVIAARMAGFGAGFLLIVWLLG